MQTAMTVVEKRVKGTGVMGGRIDRANGKSGLEGK
jgi:hypothetical protein